MMSGSWRQWEGRIVDGSFSLLRYLGGNERSAVFLTQYGEPAPRNAAIKLVRADSPDAELLARWERAAQLYHPHLIRLFRIGSCHENQIALHYAVMEYAEEDLATVLRDRPLTPEEARKVLESVLEVLTYLHGQGLAHSHLKPANIMAVDERLKISCDGIRREGELPALLERAGVYDPPEVRDGGFSAAGDIWSLGMTLVEVLTQRLPIPAGPKQKPVLPQTLPDAFLDIAGTCLQPEPQWRATVAHTETRLQRISFQPEEHQPEGPSPFKPQEASLRRRYAAPAAALGLATVLVAGVGILRRRAEPPQAPPSASSQARVQEEPERKPVSPGTRPSAKKGSADRLASPGAAATEAPIRPEAAVTPTKPSAARQVVHQVMPDVPGKARDTIRGTVRVRVRAHVDQSGRVASAELASPGPSSYFAELTLRAARRWEFEPVKVQDQNVPSEWLLHFEFTRNATKVRPVRVSP